MHNYDLKAHDCYTNKIILFETQNSSFQSFYDEFGQMKMADIPGNMIIVDQIYTNSNVTTGSNQTSTSIARLSRAMNSGSS